MPCDRQTIPLENGRTLEVVTCSPRGSGKAESCQHPGCGYRSNSLCDYPVTRRDKVGTCDRRMCEEHRYPREGGKDYCAVHDKISKGGK